MSKELPAPLRFMRGIGCPHGPPKDVGPDGFGYCPQCRRFYLYPEAKEAKA